MFNDTKIRTLVNIANSDVTSINIRFNGTDKVYLYKIKISLANTLQPGDLVLVEARDHYQVAFVVTVDPVINLDMSSNKEYKWCFEKVSLENLESLIEEEKSAVLAAKNAQRITIREKAKLMLRQGNLASSANLSVTDQREEDEIDF